LAVVAAVSASTVGRIWRARGNRRTPSGKQLHLIMHASFVI
jgi:hypothetical protein